MVTEGAVEGIVEGMMGSHSLHASIVDKLIIVLIVVRRSLANLIGLSILPLLILHPLHPEYDDYILGRL